MPFTPPLFHLKPLTRQAYPITWQAMQQFTEQRTESTADEIWLVEHDPVYTLGQNGQFDHLLKPGNIPVIHTDRGGQVTYHGPGQLIIYCLLDLHRLGCNIRNLVTALENTVIQLLASYQITAYSNPKAPGVYVKDAKIASVGLRIRRGYCYHGLALNVAMDLSPFQGINPCGFKNLQVTQLSDLGGPQYLDLVAQQWIHYWKQSLLYKK